MLVPDGTRTAPIPLMFRLLHDHLTARGATFDVLVALGTHQPMNETALRRLVGVTAEERTGRYAGVQLLNHEWSNPSALTTIGVISADEIAELTEGRLRQDVAVTLNRRVFDYDLLVICGPTFPHEVVGFSGGNKYFFPGISGAEVINFTHWLGALITSYVIIGTKDTPVRAVMNRAAAHDRPAQAVLLDGRGPGQTAGSPMAFRASTGCTPARRRRLGSAAADLSSQVHVRWVEQPFRRVLSVMPHMYDDLWTGAKGDVQDGAGHRRRRRGDHLRAAHHRDVRTPTAQRSNRSATTAGTTSEAVGSLQGHPRPRCWRTRRTCAGWARTIRRPASRSAASRSRWRPASPASTVNASTWATSTRRRSTSTMGGAGSRGHPAGAEGRRDALQVR